MIQVLKTQKSLFWVAAVCLISLLSVSLTACSNPSDSQSGPLSPLIPSVPENPVFPVIPVVSGWPITIANESTYGMVIANRDLADSGETVILAIRPSGGYRLGGLSIISGYDTVDYTVLGNDTCAFIMPNGPVKINASFATMGLVLRSISVNPTANGVIAADPAEIQRETAPVILSAQALSGYKINPASLSVTSGGRRVPVVQNDEITFSFAMPDGDATVNAAFVPQSTALQTITVSAAGNGIIGAPLAAQAGDTVEFALIPDKNYRYRENTLTVSGASPSELSAVSDAVRRWSFTMPGQAVSISAQFEEIPAHAVTATVKGRPDQGAFTVLPFVDGKNAVQFGRTAILILNIPNRFEYRYKANSFAITGGSVSDLQEALPGRIWTFTMPDQAVSAEAEIEEIISPAVTKGTSLNGAVILSGLKPDGTAPQGATVTIQGLPDPGYQINEAPVINPPLALSPDGPNKWRFTMGTTPLTISMNFTALGPLILYKGGLKPSVTLTHFEEGAGYWGGNMVHADNVEVNAETEGHNGNTRAMRVYRSTSGPGSGNGQIGLAFTVASPFNLQTNNVKALSFWIKDTNPAEARLEVWGIGDANQRKIVQNRDVNGSATEAGTWKQFIVPIPISKAGEVRRLFFIKFDMDPGDALLMDDIEFITNYVDPQIQIRDFNIVTHKFADPFDIWDYLPNKVSLVYAGDAVHADSKIVDGTSVDLGDFRTKLVEWFDFGVTFTNANGAAFNVGTHLITPPAQRNTPFVLKVTLGDSESAVLNFRVPQYLQKNIEAFQKPLTSGAAPGSNCWSDISGNNRWANLVDNVIETFDPGRLGAMLSCDAGGTETWVERYFSPAIDLTGFNTIEFQARYVEGKNPETITFAIRDDTNSWFEETFTLSEAGKKLPVRLSDFDGFNGNLTGVRFMITQGEIVISDMLADEEN